MKALQGSTVCSAHMLTRLHCRSRVGTISHTQYGFTKSNLKGLCNELTPAAGCRLVII